jgi:hypothetical protein
VGNPNYFKELFSIIHFATNNAFPARNIIDLRTSICFVCSVTSVTKDIVAILKDHIDNRIEDAWVSSSDESSQIKGTEKDFSKSV